MSRLRPASWVIVLKMADIFPPPYPEVSYNSHPRWHLSRVRPCDERVEVDGTQRNPIGRHIFRPPLHPANPRGGTLQHS
jgi:hypothetical protein